MTINISMNNGDLELDAMDNSQPSSSLLLPDSVKPARDVPKDKKNTDLTDVKLGHLPLPPRRIIGETRAP